METARQIISSQVVTGFAEQRLSNLAADIQRLNAQRCAVLDADHFAIIGLVRFSEIASKSETATRILADLMGPPPSGVVKDNAPIEVVESLFEQRGVTEVTVISSEANTFVGLITTESLSDWLLLNERRRKAELEEVLSEQKRLVDFLEQKVSNRLDEARRTLDEFGALCISLSHDIRQPLRSMKLYAEMLLDESANELGPNSKNAATRIVKLADKGEALAENLLGRARLAFGDKSQMLAVIDLNEILGDALEFLEAEIKKTNASIRVCSPLASVSGHYVPVLQIFINLIVNALKYVAADKQPVVLVWTEIIAGEITLHVQDNGVGISKEFSAALSSSVEVTSSAPTAGTGFGLRITRNAVNILGGRMRVTSFNGNGTLFTVTLPPAEGIRERSGGDFR